MNKYQLLGGGSCAVLLLLSVCMPALLTEKEQTPTVRYEQHLDAEKKQPCQRVHTEDTLCTHLPILQIDTGGQTIPGVPTGTFDCFDEDLYTYAADGTSTICAQFTLVEQAQAYNHCDDAPALEEQIRLRVRGHASREFEKAPYLLKFIDDDGEPKDVSLLGMAAHSEWALHGPYLDKSLVRNYLCYNLAGKLMDYAPNVRCCELVVNGEYRGIYLLLETVANGEGRLPLCVEEQGNKLYGYLLKLDRPTEEDVDAVRNIDTFLERSGIVKTDISLRYPGSSRLTEEMAREIELELSAFERMLYSYDYDKGAGYRAYIDVDSFVTYALINELTKNVDAGRYSTYIYKKPGGRYQMCVWDFNNACDNFPEEEHGVTGFTMQQRPYFEMLFRDEDFADAFVSRYRELRKTYFSDEALETSINETLAYLGDAIKRNSERWVDAYAADLLTNPSERNVYSQREATEQLIQWLKARCSWLDENIDVIRQYASASKVKQYNEEPY